MSTEIGHQPLLNDQGLQSQPLQIPQSQQQQIPQQQQHYTTPPQQQQIAQPPQQQQYYTTPPQQQQIAQPPRQQIVQPQLQQVEYQSCCNPIVRALPDHLKSAALAIGICMLINGLAGLIIGIVGFFTTSYYSSTTNNNYFNISVFIGHNIWVGIPYILCGIFAIVSQKKRLNHHLVNTFFAFSIISFILSMPHFAISLGTMFYWPQAYGFWFNILSIIMAIVGFALSLTCIVILGHTIYCTAAASSTATIHYQGAALQSISTQQNPGQMAQPVYMQTAVTPQASIANKLPPGQVAQPPQYGNFP